MNGLRDLRRPQRFGSRFVRSRRHEKKGKNEERRKLPTNALHSGNDAGFLARLQHPKAGGLSTALRPKITQAFDPPLTSLILGEQLRSFRSRERHAALRSGFAIFY